MPPKASLSSPCVPSPLPLPFPVPFPPPFLPLSTSFTLSPLPLPPIAPKARHILCEKQGKINEAYKKLQEGWHPRHILCEKQGKINEAYKKLQEGWLDAGDKVPPAKFGEIAQAYSECPSGKKGGDLGWFPRGKMAGPFQDVAFATPIGATSAPFKSTHGYHVILVEGRKN
ncbi:unnamed protein product [Closterium sp. Naga37s-1]|nr:unnamed protein product [Closterium sp. Naga37s-1]